jgi:hypothetical protein
MFMEEITKMIMLMLVLLGFVVGIPMQVSYKMYCEETIEENTDYEIIVNGKDTYTCTDYKENDKERTEEGKYFQNCRKDDIAIINNEEYIILSKSETKTMEIKPIVQDEKLVPSREGFFEYLNKDKKLS